MTTVRAASAALPDSLQPVVAVFARQAFDLAHVHERGTEQPRLLPGLLRQPGAADALGEPGEVADHRTGSRLAADGLPFHDHRPQAFGGRVDRGGKAGRARADHRHIEGLPGRDGCHEAEGVGDLQVRGVDQCWPLRPEPEHDNRQVRRLQAELVQHLPGALGGGVIKAGRYPVAGKKVTQLLRPLGPSLSDHPHGLEAAAALAPPLPEELRNRAVELLGRGVHRTRHPVIDLAHGERVEDGPHRSPITPANDGHPKCRRVDQADRGQHLDAIRVLRADPADDQRYRRASG